MKDKISERKFLDLACSLSLFMVFGALLGGCQRDRGETELKEGLYLNYQEIARRTSDSGTIIWKRAIQYEFHASAHKELLVRQAVQTQTERELKQGIQILDYPQPEDDLSIDSHGMVIRGGDNLNFIDGFPSYLWLPPKYRKKGAAVLPVLMKVGEKMEWNGLGVWPVIVGGKPEIQVNYYEAESGILLGVEKLKGTLTMRLVETNHEDLKDRISENKEKTSTFLKENRVQVDTVGKINYV